MVIHVQKEGYIARNFHIDQLYVRQELHSIQKWPQVGIFSPAGNPNEVKEVGQGNEQINNGDPIV